MTNPSPENPQTETATVPPAPPNPIYIQVGVVGRYGKSSRGVPWHAGIFKEDGSIDLPEGTPLYVQAPPA